MHLTTMKNTHTLSGQPDCCLWGVGHFVSQLVALLRHASAATHPLIPLVSRLLPSITMNYSSVPCAIMWSISSSSDIQMCSLSLITFTHSHGIWDQNEVVFFLLTQFSGVWKRIREGGKGGLGPTPPEWEYSNCPSNNPNKVSFIWLGRYVGSCTSCTIKVVICGDEKSPIEHSSLTLCSNRCAMPFSPYCLSHWFAIFCKISHQCTLFWKRKTISSALLGPCILGPPFS